MKFRHLIRAWSLLIFILLLGGSHVYGQDLLDPVLQRMKDAGLLYQVNLGQTVNGVTVTLDWAYADTHRIALGYTVSGWNEADVTPGADSMSHQPALTDDKGNTFSYSNSNNGVRGEQPDTWVGVINYYTQVIHPGTQPGDWVVDNDYFHNQYATMPDELNLHLELTVIGTNFNAPVPTPSADGSSVPMPPQTDPYGPFSFDFTVPLNQAIAIPVNFTAWVNNVYVTLSQVSVAPSQTEVWLSYKMPDSSDWQPDASLTIGSVLGQPSSYSLMASPGLPKQSNKLSPIAFLPATLTRGGGPDCGDPSQASRCVALTFDLFYDGKPATLTLTINQLQTSLPEDPNIIFQIRDILAKQGIEINPQVSSHGFGYDLVHAPDGVDVNQAYQAAYDSLRRHVEGPWVFTLQLPS